MSDIIYRGPGPWGAGQGSNLTAGQVDDNFYLLYSMILAAQDHGNGAGIDYFVVSGDQIWIHLTNHQVEGPYTLPVAQFKFRFAWQANTLYNPMDIVTNDGGVYLVLVANTEATFNPNLLIGGQQVYGLMINAPTTRNIALFVEGSPVSGELLLQYIVPEAMTLPANLTGSYALSQTPPSIDVEFALYKNDVAIGTVNFSTANDVTVDFVHAVDFGPGDVLYLYAPASSPADAHMTNISFTFVATLA